MSPSFKTNQLLNVLTSLATEQGRVGNNINQLDKHSKLALCGCFSLGIDAGNGILEVTQLTEVLFANGGLIIITLLFLRNMIQESGKDLETLELSQTKKEKEIFALRCSEFGLTQREVEICELVREGLIYREIADTLSISERTVSKHMENIFRKAEVRNKTELIHRISKKNNSS